MRKWKVWYAFRVDGIYNEESMIVNGEFLDEAYNVAHAILNEKAHNNVWDCYLIWDVGIITDADEEVC